MLCYTNVSIQNNLQLKLANCYMLIISQKVKTKKQKTTTTKKNPENFLLNVVFSKKSGKKKYMCAYLLLL